jgi:hypothetical protein
LRRSNESHLSSDDSELDQMAESLSFRRSWMANELPAAKADVVARALSVVEASAVFNAQVDASFEI